MQLTSSTRLRPLRDPDAPRRRRPGRARDTKLGRDVALKILPERASRTIPVGPARFQREAQILATLNHPRIATIHGFDEANGRQFVVLELLDGPTLNQQIGGKAMRIDRLLDLALQIADALDAAHSRGIVSPRHRAGETPS